MFVGQSDWPSELYTCILSVSYQTVGDCLDGLESSTAESDPCLLDFLVFDDLLHTWPHGEPLKNK
jgi:hypothetical protein